MTARKAPPCPVAGSFLRHHLYKSLTPHHLADDAKGVQTDWIGKIWNGNDDSGIYASRMSKWLSGIEYCKKPHLTAVLDAIKRTDHGRGPHGKVEEIEDALTFFYKYPDILTASPADVPVPALAQAHLNRLAQGPAANSVKPPSVLDSLLARWSVTAFHADHLAPTSSAILAARRGDLFHTFGAPDMASMQLQWLPSGTVQMPDLALVRVERPVAVLFQAVDRAEAGLEVRPGGTASQMATGVSLDDARRHAERLSALTGKHWRLPRVAEWWMAMSAGTGRAPSSGSSGGLWLDEVPLNTWEVRPPPPAAMEWVADEGRPTGAIGGRGERLPMRSDIRSPVVGYRLVLDWFREG